MVSDSKQPSLRWYEGITGYQWLVLTIASLGWIFDIFEGQYFVASMRDAMPALLGVLPDDPLVSNWNDRAFGSFLLGGAFGGVLFGMLGDKIDPETGETIWTCQGLAHSRGDLAYSSPTLVGNLCFMTGGYQGPMMAVKLGGQGDVSETHRLWRTEKQPQSIGSPIAAGGMIYRANAGPGTIDQHVARARIGTRVGCDDVSGACGKFHGSGIGHDAGDGAD